MKVVGQSCRALLDTGADRSFCTPETVRRSGLSLRPGKLEVSSAGGQILKALGSVQTHLEVGKLSTDADLWVTTLPKGIEVILGCDWLQQNGVVIDMAKRTVRFAQRMHPADPKPDTLQIRVERSAVQSRDVGTPTSEATARLSRSKPISPPTELIGLLAIHSRSDVLVKTATEGLLAAVNSSRDLFGRDTELSFELGELQPLGMAHPELSKILQEYSDVFPPDLPRGVPPERRALCENIKAIPLEPGAQPKKQRQYRLSPLERSELDRQVEYM